jgi:hypothetical protein
VVPTSTPIVVTATPTATSVATAGPTATVAQPTATTGSANPGTLLYKADWSGGLSGWVGSAQWKVLNGQLLNDGSGSGNILAPYLPRTPDYAIEVRVQVIRVYPAGCSNFGLVARQTQNNQEGYAALMNCLALDAPFGGFIQLLGNNNTVLAQVNYSPGPDWHIYRLEVKGNQIQIFVDGSIAAAAVDNTFLMSGRVGLADDSVEITVSSFAIYSL